MSTNAEVPQPSKTLFEILDGAKMTTKDGTPLTVDDLKRRDSFALYFSAHWCPPCRGFTPKLAATYMKMQEAKKNVDIVFVSSDKDEDQYKEYRAEMPWSALDFKDGVTADLKRLCKVNGIPALATFKGCDGSLVNKNARGLAGEDEAGADFPWPKKPLPACSTFSPRREVYEAFEGVCVVLACDCPHRAPGCCDAGCKLPSFETNHEGYGCDMCNESMEKGVTMFGCRQHNYDLCVKCHTVDAAREVKEFDAAKDDAVKAEFTKGAEQFHADAKAKGVEETGVAFFIVSSTQGMGLYSSLANHLGAEARAEGTPTVLAFNMENNKAKAVLSEAVTARSVVEHATTFKQSQKE